MKKKYLANKDQILEKSKAYYLANSEAIKKRVNEYRENNPSVIQERKREYYKKNKDRILQGSRDKNKENPSIRASYRSKNKESISSYMAQWSTNNPVKRRANEARRRSRTIGKYTGEMVEYLRKTQKNKCVVCTKKLGDDYEIDHIVPISLGGGNNNDNIQLLCQRCNRQKHAKDPIEFMQSKGFLL